MRPRLRPKNPAQALMETDLMALMYESFLWRRNPLLVLLLGINSSREYSLLAHAMQLKGSETILDLACGPGIYTRRLAKEARQGIVFGIDLSWPMLKHGKQLLQRNKFSNVSLLQGDAVRLPFRNDHFDVVNCAAALHLFGDLAGTFAEVSRVLKPEGRFTFSTFHEPKDKLITSYMRLRRGIAGIRSFRQEEIDNELQKAGFGEIRTLHAKGIWVVMSAKKDAISQ